MGKLLDLFRNAPQQQAPERRVQGEMIDLEIVGESFHQDEIRKIAKRVGRDEFPITLRPEPHNPYDKNAVAVFVDAVSVGHLAKAMAKDWQPMIMSAQAEGFSVVGTATVFGGTKEKPSLGVFGSAPWPGHGAPPDRWRSARPAGPAGQQWPPKS